MSRLRAIGAALCCVWLSAWPASAQLAVDKLWVDLSSKTDNRADVVVRNESADRYYISVAPVEIVHPGAPDEKRVENSDPDQLGLLVTPNRMIVDPGGIRSVRIVSLNAKLTADRIYRIRITPQVGDIEATKVSSGDHGMTIKVLAAYDVLVTVRPDDAKANIVAVREPTDVVLRNAGNSNILLLDGRACAPADAAGGNADSAEKCEDVESRRLYAGNEWKIPIKSPGTKIKFKQRKDLSSDPKDVSF